TPKGRSWYCDAVAVNFRDERVFLCEVTYSSTLNALLTRLRAWSAHWQALRPPLLRGCPGAPWEVKAWRFIPRDLRHTLEKKLVSVRSAGAPGSCLPEPKVTSLEEVVPWKYRDTTGERHDGRDR